MNPLQFADSVWHRVIQIVQEAMMTGTDASDLLRQIRVMPDASDEHTLVLTPEYQQLVRESHEKLLKQARELEAKQSSNNKFIITGNGSAENN